MTKFATKREEDLQKALDGLLEGLDSHVKDGKRTLLDHVWYAYEIADYVSKGSTLQEALEKFIDPNGIWSR